MSAPLFKLLTLQTVLPLAISDESVALIVGFCERSGYDFTVCVEEITAEDLEACQERGSLNLNERSGEGFVPSD